MEVNKNSSELRFILPMDTFVSQEQARQYKETQSRAAPLRQALDALLAYVRSNYLEIDLSVTGVEAIKNFTSND
jgi:hypothetical protein